MPDTEHSVSRRVLRGIPIPVIALVFGLLTGLLTWVVVDRFQTEALSEIFNQALDNQLDQQARESLIRFDEYRRSFTFLARLLANHRRMADYLDPILWPDPVEIVKVYGDTPPHMVAA